MAKNSHKDFDKTRDINSVINELSEQTRRDYSDRYNSGDYVVIDENGNISSGMDVSPESEGKKKKKPLVAVIIAVAAVALIAIGGFSWYMLSGSSTLSKNVRISGNDVGGMSVGEAKTALAGAEKKLADEINITVKIGGDTVTLKKDDVSYSFNTDDVLNKAKEYSEQKGIKSGEQSYKIEMSVSDESLKKAAEKIAEDHNTEPKDAKVTEYDSKGSGAFTFEKETDGLSVKADELAQLMIDSVKKGSFTATVDAPCDILKPKYTKEFLEKNIKKLSSYSTYSTNNSNGNNNMKVSLSACNNSIIDPGEVWSFNGCTGDSNLESNGYLPAGVIVEGRHETGVGGGICQSSTTIYNAALLCGMTVEERSCHYYKSTYVEAGRDATVDYGNLDLKLSNPFDTQLFMKCYMDGAELHCEMYGVEQEAFDDIKIFTEVTSYFSTGYKVAATRAYYKDGEKIDSDSLPESTYYTVAPKSSKKTSSKKASSSPSSSAASDDDDDDDSQVQSDDDTDDSPDSDDSSDDNQGDDSGDSGADEPQDDGGSADVEDNTPDDSPAEDSVQDEE